MNTRKGRRRATAVALALTVSAAQVILGTGSATIAAVPAAATEPAPQTRWFNSINGEDWTVPAGVRTLHAKVVGSAGGGGGDVVIPGIDLNLTSDGKGGAGRVVEATIPVVPGQVLRFYASLAGSNMGRKTTDIGGGGPGFRGGGSGNTSSGTNPSPSSRAGAGGGGASAVTDASGNPIVVAGGGGGGGGRGCFAGTRGGDGGPGDLDGIAGTGGGGGSGGRAGNTAGNGGTGGNARSSSLAGGSGGGGGGWPSGGGGGRAGSDGCGGGGGGGGGRSFIDTSKATLLSQGYNPGSGGVQLSWSVQFPTSTTVTPSSSSVFFGQTTDVNVTVSNMEDSAQKPIGSLTLTGPDGRIGTPQPLVNGQTTFTGVQLPVGSGELVANYSPDISLFKASNGRGTVQVSPSPSHFAEVTASNPPVGQELTVTGSVLPGATRVTPDMPVPNNTAAADVPGPAGVITVSLAGVEVGTAQLNPDGTFSTQLPWAAGLRLLTLNFGGDGNYLAAAPATLSVEGTKARPIVTAIPQNLTPTNATPVQVALGVSAEAGIAAQPSGTLVLSVDGAPVLAPFTLDARGQATAVLAPLTDGNHQITASYPGDELFQTGESSPVVIAVRTPEDPAPANLTATGGNATATGGTYRNYFGQVPPIASSGVSQLAATGVAGGFLGSSLLAALALVAAGGAVIWSVRHKGPLTRRQG